MNVTRAIIISSFNILNTPPPERGKKILTSFTLGE